MDEARKRLIEQQSKILEQSKEMAELKSKLSSVDQKNFPEAISSLQNSLKEKNEEIKRLEAVMKEQKESYQRENNLIVSGWYKYQCQVQELLNRKSPTNQK